MGSTASSPGTPGSRRGSPAATKVLLAENGDVIRFDDEGGRVAEQGAGRPDPDRRHPQRRGRRRGAARPPAPGRATAWSCRSWRSAGSPGALEETPDVITRGFVLDARTEALLKEIPSLLAATLEAASVEERTDPGLIKEKIRVDLQRFFRKRSGLRPLVLPVVMEI